MKLKGLVPVNVGNVEMLLNVWYGREEEEREDEDKGGSCSLVSELPSQEIILI